MITPKFDVIQDDQFIILTIHVPYLKISEMEMFIEGTQFKFYLKPYYLRLNFSHEIVENGEEKAQYSVDTGDIIMKLPKATSGQHFEDLDMISKLLSSKASAPIVGHGIEVLDSIEAESSNKEDDDFIDEDFSWEIDQTEPSPIVSTIKYGFANQHSDLFGRLLPEYPYVIDLKDPETCSPAERKELRDMDLQEAFNIQHYIADTVDDTLISDVIGNNPWYRSSVNRCISVDEGLANSFIDLKINSSDGHFNEEEKELLMLLPRKNLILEKSDHQRALLGIVDILFAYAYDHRITYGDPCVESAWNICKLSSQLSWLYTPPNLQKSLIHSFMRCLSYPLFRHFNLCQTAFDDVKTILYKGRHAVLKCFLRIFDILRKHDYYYLLNVAFIQDYCLWLQTIKDNKIDKLHEALTKITITKADLSALSLVKIDTIVEDMNQSLSSDDSSSSSEYSSESNFSSSEEDTLESSEEENDGVAPAGDDELVDEINLNDLTFEEVLAVGMEDKENCMINVIGPNKVVSNGKDNKGEEKSGKEKLNKVLIEEIL